jgi:putative ABC transport system permease protein
MAALLRDLRYAFRTLGSHPGSTLIIVASLAIGIGANTAIFSVVNALLLKPLPYPDPERLAALWLRSPGINIPKDWPSPGQYIDILQENRSFEAVAISRGTAATLIRSDRPERVQVLRTSSNLFPMFGAQALHGRLFLPEEDVPGKAPTIVLSHGFWTRMFGADPGIVGKSIILNGVAPRGDTNNQFTVVGVLSPTFWMNNEVMQTVASLQQLDVFLPLPLGADAVKRRGDENFNLMARLKPGVTMAKAQADIDLIAGRIRDKDKRDRTFTISVVPLRDQVVGDVRRAVLVLLGSVALVLLIACANVANLLLTRASGRQKEVAIRTALGASWRQVVGQLLTESVLLGLIGGAAGLLVAQASLVVVRALNPGNIPRLEAITIDPTVLAFTFGVSLLTGVIFGLAPAFRAASVDLSTTLKAGGRSGQGDGGFGSTRLRLRSSGRQFPTPQASNEFFRVISERIANVPGVTHRGSTSSLPFTNAVGWGSINVEGFQPRPGQELQVDIRGASPDYFRTMEIPVIKGRAFTLDDTAPDAQPVTIVDEPFARRFWPNGDVIGKTLWFDPKRRMTIVGVVGMVKQDGLDIDGRIVTYMPMGFVGGYQVARTASSEPASVAAAIARTIQSVDPTIPIYDVRTMPDRMYDSMARQRFSTLMLGAFAGFALLLAVIGVYGVLAHLVAQGRHEIGVRMALGAPRGRILAMVVRQGLELTAAGVVLGLLGALALTRVMATLLFGISATDVITFGLVPVLLIVVALVACLIPARRATNVDPQIALRVD